MKLRPSAILHAFDVALLRSASMLVPAGQRAEWYREWRSELWHVRRECVPVCSIAWQAEREVAAFCMGAFQDGLSLRAEAKPRTVRLSMAKGSARHCLLSLSAIVAVSCSLAMMLPNVHAKLQSPAYRLPADLVLIGNAESGAATPTLSAEQFRAWRRRHQELFDGFAFYKVERESLTGVSRGQSTLAIVHTSSNLFEMLHVPVRFATHDNQSGLPAIVLSDAVWKREFGGDPNVAGRLVRVGLRDARVAGVASADAWELPGKADAWLLGVDNETADAATGFVVGHVSASGPHWGSSWAMSAPKPDGSMNDFQCVALREGTLEPLGIFLVMVLLAFLALPATTPLALGDYLLSARRISWSTRLRRWGFLGGKIALLLPVVYFASMDLAYASAKLGGTSAQYVQIISSFAVCLFGLRWALRDQRQRCPVCLGKLTHPARVGQPSRNFLAWNGTELMCVGGHGLMHVPELATSWFSTQRWMYLDASWDVLFVKSRLASTGYF